MLVFKTFWWRLQHVLSVKNFRLPSRYEDVLQKCLQDISQQVLKTSWRHVQDVLEEEKLLCWRRLQDVSKTCLEDVLKTFLEDVLKTCLEDVTKTSWRQTKNLLAISASNKCKCVFSKSVSDESKTYPKCIN